MPACSARTSCWQESFRTRFRTMTKIRAMMRTMPIERRLARCISHVSRADRGAFIASLRDGKIGHGDHGRRV